MKYSVILFLIHLVLAEVCNCEKYNPDIYLTTPQIIRRHGYPAESHLVTTDDGYILTIHRIPAGVKETNTGEKRVVFLQHGLLGSSTAWILAGPEKSLAYILADQGYDVWMGNARGNDYSRAHVSLSPDDIKFWDFSWHEMAKYDLPAEIDYILSRTNQDRLFYVGHSMGTTMFFAFTTMLPAYNDKIIGMVALAPVVFLSYIESPIKFLAPWANDLQFLMKYLGEGSFLPHNKLMEFLAKYGCEAANIERDICKNSLFIFCGFDKSQFNMTLQPVLLGHSPAGTSTKTLVHFAQLINSGKFQEYDYGTKENKVRYNTPAPPKYNLSITSTPTALYYADNDWLASVSDVLHLSRLLKNKFNLRLIDYKGFNHLDFVWAIDVKKLVYVHLLEQLREWENSEEIEVS